MPFFIVISSGPDSYRIEMTTILIIGIMEDSVIKTTLTKMIFNSISQKK